jgi:ABC-type dipeptide/oligopeptide/nickel transport system permease component
MGPRGKIGARGLAGRAAAVALAPLGALAVAAAPLLFERRGGTPALALAPAAEAIASWVRGLADGSSFRYRHGATQWNFFDVAPRFFAVSLLYVTLAGSLGLLGGLALGLRLKGRPARLVASALDSLFAVPDFILAILLQLLTLVVLDACGVKLGRISYDASGGFLLALPLALLTLYPLAFSFRLTLRKARDAEAEPFAVFALAKGLDPGAVRRRHIGAAVVPAMSAELPTILGIMQANLFMTEYIFALPGITRFLFQVAFSGRRPGWIEQYQFQLAAAVLLGVVILYGAAQLVLALALRIARRVLTGER